MLLARFNLTWGSNSVQITTRRVWKYFKVRPLHGATNPRNCDVRYCQYDVPHKDYIYTDGWVELLVSKLADPIKFAEILGKEPEKLSQEAA